MHEYLACMSKYAQFDGRATRKEFWLFGLVVFLITAGAMAADHVLDTLLLDAGIGVVSGIVVLVHALPGIAVAVRRLHDTGRSGWWYLLNFVPLGGLAVLVFMLLPGASGPNRFGDDPRGATFDGSWAAGTT